jgi:hypothetical protein
VTVIEFADLIEFTAAVRMALADWLAIPFDAPEFEDGLEELPHPATNAPAIANAPMARLSLTFGSPLMPGDMF